MVRLIIRLPDRGQTGGLGGHHINAVSEISRHTAHAGADELHDLILDIAALEHRADNR